MRDAGLTIWNAVEPFPSIKEFVDFFLDDIDENVLPEKTQWKEILYERTEYLTLSHGDLHPHNIMVKKSAKTGRLTVTGIVDWTTAGWFPIYWEAFKARKTLAAPKNWNQFARFFTGYPKEAIEILEEMHSGSPR